MRRSTRLLWMTCSLLLALGAVPLMAQDGGDDMFADEPADFGNTEMAEFEAAMEQMGEEMGEAMGEAMAEMMGEILAALEQAVRESSPAIAAKVGTGATLTAEELRTVALKAATAMGADPSEVPDEIDMASEEAVQISQFLKMLRPKFAGGAADTGAPAAPVAAPVVDVAADMLFVDFIHYIRIARFDLASSNGKAWLAKSLTPEQVLSVVEQGAYKPIDIAHTLEVALKAGGDIGAVAKDVELRIERARLDLARNPQRIRDNIERLAQGLRARRNATQRLQEAGQYAAPYLLASLLDGDDRPLHPYVTQAMISVGREVVQPVCESLSQVPPITQQQIARVLAEIGYPLAIPYLKAVLETGEPDPGTRNVLEQAVARLSQEAGIPVDRGGGELFYLLAEDYYAHRRSLILHPSDPTNLMWVYQRGTGLVRLEIPTAIYHDVMAMRAARRALELDNDMSAALSLWVSANFRRENNLPAGTTDPSYSAQMRSPSYYATMAGPAHLQPVLQRALNDGDAEVALDAIAALRATAGDVSLLARDAENQPLALGLNFSDRRVRFESAFAIAEARPTSDFPNAQRVVPVLTEAIRQSGDLFALVIAEDLETASAVADHVRQAGSFEILLGTSIESAAAIVADAPGVDLVVVHGTEPQVEQIHAGARRSVKLQVAPIVVLAGPGEIISLTRRFEPDRGVLVVKQSETGESVVAGVQQMMRDLAGDQLSEGNALAYALHAMALLREMAIGLSSDVFHIEDGQAALLEALNDDREAVLLSAASVVAQLDSEQAQQALAEVTLFQEHSESVQVALLGSLAESSRRFGPRVTERQTRMLLELVSTARGDLADAAGATHGAMDLPTANAVELIVER